MKFDIRETASERIILCAHRGIWGGNIPCNNTIAYDFALAEGADMVEVDVTRSADGELFIFHPGMERRQFGKDINIRQMNAEEIRQLRLVNELLELKRAELTGDFEIVEEPIPAASAAPAAAAEQEQVKELPKPASKFPPINLG